uniref:Parathyroid hormone 2 receptor n=1 Tax=Sphaerodactylus townsendi TaxID=933632 RepID=A0ACB8FZM5_9SAUR
MYTVGYSVSFSSLAVAIFIIGYFRATSIFIKDKVVHTQVGVKELDSLLIRDLQSAVVVPLLDKSQYVGCKITVVMFIYFLATNYYWILVEGLYLHSLIFVAFFSDTKYLWGFTLIGWVSASSHRQLLCMVVSFGPMARIPASPLQFHLRFELRLLFEIHPRLPPDGHPM